MENKGPSLRSDDAAHPIVAYNHDDLVHWILPGGTL